MEEDTQKEVVQNREGKVDDYILVKFIPLKSKDPKHNVGKIIEPETHDEDDELSCFILSSVSKDARELCYTSS